MLQVRIIIFRCCCSNDARILSRYISALNHIFLIYLSLYNCFLNLNKCTIGGDYDLARNELASVGWELVEWYPRPGLAKHSGLARAIIK